MNKEALNLLMQIAKKVKFSTETKSTQITISSGSFGAVTVPLPSKKAIGITGVWASGTGAANLALWDFHLTPSGAAVEMTNHASASRTVTINVQYVVIDA